MVESRTTCLVLIVTEVQSSWTSLASRTHFEVLGLEGQVFGLEAYKSSKIPCPPPRTALFFEALKIGHCHDRFFTLSRRTPETSRKICRDLFFFFERRLKFRGKFSVSRAMTFFWRTLARYVLASWPRAFLSLAARGSVLEHSVGSSTPPMNCKQIDKE